MRHVENNAVDTVAVVSVVVVVVGDGDDADGFGKTKTGMDVETVLKSEMILETERCVLVDGSCK